MAWLKVKALLLTSVKCLKFEENQVHLKMYNYFKKLIHVGKRNL